MTQAATNVLKPASPKAKAKQTSAPGKAPALQVTAAAAPKPARRRSAVVPKAGPAKVEALATSAPAAKKSPARRAPRVAKVAVEIAAKVAKPAKAKKTKLVRDSFTMPESEYAAIAALKARCLSSGVAAKKSEVLRAAIAAFAKLSDANVTAAIKNLAEIKTGRPAKDAK